MRIPSNKRPINRVLIVRLSAIGDVIMASALLPALCRAYPRARIDWLVEPPARDIVTAHPSVDEAIVWPKGQWRQMAKQGHWFRLVAQAARLIWRLRRKRYNLVLDLQGLGKSGLWARVTGAPRRLGLESREGTNRLMTQIVERPTDDPRMGAEYRRVAEALDLETAEFAPDIAIGPQPRIVGVQRLGEVGVAGPYAVVLPFTTRPQKHWPERYWPKLAHQVGKRYGLPTVMLGGPGDREPARRIQYDSEGAVRDLVGQTSLGESLGIIAGSRLAVGVDTGLTHAAVGLGIPTVALFGSTRPYLEPANSRATVLHDDLACAPCRRHPTCGGSFDCMQNLTPERVMAALEGVGPRPANRPGAIES